MSPLDLLTSSHTVHLFGFTLSMGPRGYAAVLGWALFAVGALLAVRDRVGGPAVRVVTPLVGAGTTLAAMAAGLGLLLMEGYPDFARTFCFPYALLALAVAVLGQAMQAGGAPIGEE